MVDDGRDGHMGTDVWQRGDEDEKAEGFYEEAVYDQYDFSNLRPKKWAC